MKADISVPWWHPSRHADRRPALLARNRLQAGIRGWFAEREFLEVDPSALQISPGNETHLHAFTCTAIGNDGQGQPRYLHTSPEFAMKKLLAAGERRIFSFAHVWRNRERGARHSPEFTMLEWYRVGEPYEVLIYDTIAILRLAAGGGTLRHRDMICDPAQEPQRLSVAEAFRLYAGVDLLSTLDGAATDRDALAAQAVAAGLRVAGDDVWSDIFSRVLSERVEPQLGQGRITILDRYPAAEAALAAQVGLQALYPLAPVAARLREALEAGEGADTLLPWLQEHVPASTRDEPEYVRLLVTSLLARCVPGAVGACTPAEAACSVGQPGYGRLLRAAAGGKPQLRVAAVFAAQALCEQAGHPAGLGTALLGALCQAKAVDSRALTRWSDDNKDQAKGKLAMVKAVSRWIQDKLAQEEAEASESDEE